MTSDGYEIFEDIDGLLDSIVSGAPVKDVLAAAIDVCEARRPLEIWHELRELSLAADLRCMRDWWHDLLACEPPEDEINGLWFGLFNPVVDGRTSAGMYVSGSRSWPSADWACDTEWWPDGRYAPSMVLAELHSRTAETGDSAVAYYGFFLTLAYAGATVVSLVGDTNPVDLAGANGRGIAFGHDSGDCFEIGRVELSTIRWRVP